MTQEDRDCDQEPSEASTKVITVVEGTGEHWTMAMYGPEVTFYLPSIIGNWEIVEGSVDSPE